jgi:hypothetical protein
MGKKKTLPKSWRLDEVAAIRLKEISEITHTSQATIIEEMISACYRESENKFEGQSEKGFMRFVDSMRWRYEEAEYRQNE